MYWTPFQRGTHIWSVVASWWVIEAHWEVPWGYSGASENPPGPIIAFTSLYNDVLWGRKSIQTGEHFSKCSSLGMLWSRDDPFWMLFPNIGTGKRIPNIGTGERAPDIRTGNRIPILGQGSVLHWDGDTYDNPPDKKPKITRGKLQLHQTPHIGFF